MKIKASLRHIVILLYSILGRYFRSSTCEGDSGKTRVLVFHHLDKPSRFEKIVVLLKKKYNFISFDDYLSGNAANNKINLIVAFDDGYESWFKFGLPLFIKHNLKPILFVNSDYIGLEKAEAFRYCSKDINTWGEGSLTWSNLIELKRAGCVIGGHSIKHTDLTDTGLGAREMRSLVDIDKRVIDKKLDQCTKIFAYPYGRWNNSTVTAAKAAGYKYAFTSDSGYLEASENCLTLKRTNVGMRMPIVVSAYAGGWSEKVTKHMAVIRSFFSDH